MFKAGCAHSWGGNAGRVEGGRGVKIEASCGYMRWHDTLRNPGGGWVRAGVTPTVASS